MADPESLGLDSERLERAFALVARGAAAGAYAGAVALVARHGEVAACRACGWAVREPAQPGDPAPVPMTPETRFDLASLTKVVATLPSVLRLVDAGELPLDLPVAEVLPAYGTAGERGAVTVRHLLSHSSGLPARFGVSRMTARQALNELEAEGYLTRARGSGSYVSVPKLEQTLTAVTSFTEDMKQRGLQPDARVLVTDVVHADGQLARLMELADGAAVVRIQCLRLASEEPMALEVTHLPLARFPGLEEVDLTGRSLYQLLRERYQVVPERAVQSLEAVLAGAHEAHHLGLSEGAPLLLLRRIARDAAGTVIEYVRSHYRGDRYRFITELRTGLPGGLV